MKQVSNINLTKIWKNAENGKLIWRDSIADAFGIENGTNVKTRCRLRREARPCVDETWLEAWNKLGPVDLIQREIHIRSVGMEVLAIKTKPNHYYVRSLDNEGVGTEVWVPPRHARKLTLTRKEGANWLKHNKKELKVISVDLEWLNE